MCTGIERYITRVCRDACVSERRPVDVQYQYSIVNGILVFAVKCPWKKVERRISYRLDRNLKRNFGITFCNVSERNHNHRVDFIKDIDPNFSFAEWDMFGEWGTLRTGEDPVLNPHLHISAGSGDEVTKYQALENAGYSYSNFTEHNHEDWVRFCEYYKKAFGEYPRGAGETIRVSVKE